MRPFLSRSGMFTFDETHIEWHADAFVEYEEAAPAAKEISSPEPLQKGSS
jgi:hypothetical protein